MYAAIILCSAMLAADTDTISVRVVNTLDEPVQMKFRVVGKQDWLKDELALKSAETKNVDLPKADKYEIVVRDAKAKDLPVGSWDLAKMLVKDAKAELHIVERKAARTANPPQAGTKTYTVQVPVTETAVIGGKEVAITRMVMETRTREVTAAEAAVANSRVELTVFANKQYVPIAEFIDGKRLESPADKASPAAPAPDGPTPISVPIIIDD